MDKLQWKQIQKLQDIYSQALGLAIVMTDSNGNRVTERSGYQDMKEALFEANTMNDSMKRLLEQLREYPRMVLYEGRYGMKYIVSPIWIEGKPQYYIWSGIMIEKWTRPLMKQNAQKCMLPIEYERWEQAVELVADTTEEQKRSLMDQIGHLAEISASVIMEKKLEGKLVSAFGILNELSASSKTFESIFGSLTLFSKAVGLEVAGLATQTKSDSFVIRYTVGGQGHEQLVDSLVMAGEGFLGQVRLTEQLGYWEHVGNDPRTAFFNQFGLFPKTVVAYPVKFKDKMTGILFGLSDSESLSPLYIEFGKLIATMSGKHIGVCELEGQSQKQSFRLITLLEVCQVMKDMKDLLGIAVTLVDFAYNSANAAFSYAVVKRPGEDVQAFNRGLGEEEMDDFVEEVNARVFANSTGRACSPQQPHTYTTDDGITVMEFLMYVRDRVVAVLGVAVRGEAKAAEFRHFLSALASIGEMRIQYLHELQLSQTIESVDMLHQTVLERNRDEFVYAARAKGLAIQFARRLDLPAEDIEQLGIACLLFKYSDDFIERKLHLPRVAQLLANAKQLMNSKDNPSVLGTKSYDTITLVFCIVTHYVLQYETIESLEDYRPVHNQLVGQFIEFVGKDEPADEGPAPLLKWAVEPMQSEPPLELGALTPRERDVFDLIILGLSNQDIAAKLHISVHTVKNHSTKIYEKLGVSDRTQVMAKMYFGDFYVKHKN